MVVRISRIPAEGELEQIVGEVSVVVAFWSAIDEVMTGPIVERGYGSVYRPSLLPLYDGVIAFPYDWAKDVHAIVQIGIVRLWLMVGVAVATVDPLTVYLRNIAMLRAVGPGSIVGGFRIHADLPFFRPRSS